MDSRWLSYSIGAIGVLGVLVACSGPAPEAFNGPDASSDAECKRGDTQPCTCVDGKPSSRTCSSAGRFLECACEPKAAVCADGTCDPGETCKSCPQDCGACPVCTQARSCKTVSGPPGQLEAKKTFDVKLEARSKDQVLAELVAEAQRGAPGLVALSKALTTDDASDLRVTRLRAAIAKQPLLAAALRRQLTRTELASALGRARIEAAPYSAPLLPTREGDAGALGDGGFGDGGAAVQCDPTKLRVRLGQITVHEEDDDLANDIVFCQITAESPGGSEARLTPKTPNLDEGDTHVFGGTAASFWGQREARDPAGDLSIRYDCYEQDDPSSYANFAKRLGELLADEAAEQLPDGYGWLSTVVDLAARYLPQLLALDSDDHLLSATQTIPRSAQLEVARGATWTVRKKGRHLNSDWDWALRIDAWGCVDNGFVE